MPEEIRGDYLADQRLARLIDGMLLTRSLPHSGKDGSAPGAGRGSELSASLRWPMR